MHPIKRETGNLNPRLLGGGFCGRRLHVLQQLALLTITLAAHSMANCRASQEATNSSLRQTQSIANELRNQSEQIGKQDELLGSPLSSATSGQLGAAKQTADEESMKFPLYMRILATLACAIILSVGVCGNLLVPLVVIKTKYLRNSTNLFLINLSIADLLVLIVCMPTVLIELHSRPETWLLGGTMCKLSNFVEMLAANGSIFTILAISFERYYAICKPLKAGYKCTRLRATVIICLIWLLSSILTSPILIMAKSSQTVYIDGSLVYNCILETDSYWPKMYVFVSMFAFFCLPLVVLMFVYWLIGRRLIRENLAMSGRDTSGPNEHKSSLDTNGDGIGTRAAAKASSFGKWISFRRFVTLKTISDFFAPLFGQSRRQAESSKPARMTSYQHYCLVTATSGPNKQKLSSGKAFSFDHHLVTNGGQNGFRNIDPTGNCFSGGIDPTANFKVESSKVAHDLPRTERISMTNRFVRQLFRLNGKSTFDGNGDPLEKHAPPSTSTKCSAVPNQLSANTAARCDGLALHSIRELQTKGCQALESESSNTDHGSQVPFLSNIREGIGGEEPEEKMNSASGGRFRFKWAKSFSVISSSSASTFTQTTSTNLPSDSSLEPASIQTGVSSVQRSPGLYSHRCNSVTNQLGTRLRIRVGGKREFVRRGSKRATRARTSTSSASELSQSPYSSKSPSPDSMSEQRIPLYRAQGGGSPNTERSNFRQGSHSSPTFGEFKLSGDDILLIVDEKNMKKKPGTDGITLIKGSRNTRIYFTDRDAAGEDPDKVTNQPDKYGSLSRTETFGSIAKRESSGQNHELARHHHHLDFKRNKRRSGSQPVVCSQTRNGAHISELMAVQDISKKQQMDSRRQVVVMLAFVVACFFLLFFPYRVFTIWLILSTEDQVQSLGMETYYNLTYFSRILIYLHSAINPIAYNLISTKFRRAFMSILLCRGRATRRHFTTEHRILRK